MSTQPAKLLQRISSTKESILEIKMAQSSFHLTRMNTKETFRRWCNSTRTRSSSREALIRSSSSQEKDTKWIAKTWKSLSQIRKNSLRATTTMSLITYRIVFNMIKTILWVIRWILMPSLIVELKQHLQPKSTSKGSIARFKQLQLLLSHVVLIHTSRTHSLVELARMSPGYIRMERWVTKAWMNCKQLRITWWIWRINRYTMMHFRWRNINKLWCMSSACWRKRPNQSPVAKEMRPWAHWDQLLWERMLLSDRLSPSSALVGHMVIRLPRRHLHRRANQKQSKVDQNNQRRLWMTMNNFKSK